MEGLTLKLSTPLTVKGKYKYSKFQPQVVFINKFLKFHLHAIHSTMLIETDEYLQEKNSIFGTPVF